MSLANNNALYKSIKLLIEKAKTQIARNVNMTLVLTYFEIGRAIVEFEQKGKYKASYAKNTLEHLSKMLTNDFGKGFSSSNLEYIRSEAESSFYEIEAANQNWSVRELQRQFNSSLYERVALSKDKKGIRELSRKGQIIEKPTHALKHHTVLEFLDLHEDERYTESNLENAIINKIEHFMLELGKGFLFEGRQKRFTFDAESFFVDLVLYNRLLRCFVLIDLKIGKLTH